MTEPHTHVHASSRPKWQSGQYDACVVLGDSTLQALDVEPLVQSFSTADAAAVPEKKQLVVVDFDVDARSCCGMPSAVSSVARAPCAHHKRLRHRKYVKKSYDKRMNQTKALNEELAKCEAQLNDLLRLREASDEELQPLRQKYIDISALKTQLYAENRALYQMNAEYMIVESRYQSVCDTESRIPVSDRRFRCCSLPEVEYTKIITSARDDVIKFMHSEGKLTTGVDVLGWRDQKKVEGDVLTFALEKPFGLSAWELMQRTWSIVSSATQYPKVYNPALNSTLHVLEHVNPDTVLFYRTISAEGSGVTCKTVFVLARVRIDDGYLLIFRSIDKDRVAFREDGFNECVEDMRRMAQHRVGGGTATASRTHEVWVDKFVWITICETGRARCLFHFGGSTSSAVWLKEVLFIVLRWEVMAVGPQILLEQ